MDCEEENRLPQNLCDENRCKWRILLQKIADGVRKHTDDIHYMGKELHDEYTNTVEGYRHVLLEEYLQIADAFRNDHIFMRRFLIVTIDFLKWRLCDESAQRFFSVSSVKRSVCDEFTFLRDQLLLYERRCADLSCETAEGKYRSALKSVQMGFINLLTDYLRLEVELYASQHLFCNIPTIADKAHYVQVVGTMPVRVDIAGGWTDTPPITFAHSNGVVNIAVNVDGKRPVKCIIKKILGSNKEGLVLTNGQAEEEMIIIRSIDELEKLSQCPEMFGSLICASIRSTGFLHAGITSIRELFDVLFPEEKVMELHVMTSSDLPLGSGLGTSSIMSACFLCTLAKIMDKEFDRITISATVLQAEQILRTGGGWQDQIGALYPGLKYTSYAEGSVVHEFLSGRREFVQQIENIASDAETAYNSLLENKFPVDVCRRYSVLKSSMALNAFPREVQSLFETLEDKGIIETGWMCGAGGGGFACVWLTDRSDAKKLLDSLVNEWNPEAGICSATIERNPIHIMSVIEFSQSYSGKPKGKYIFMRDRNETKRIDEEKTTSLKALMTSVFLPQGYPFTVTDDYMSYQLWDTLQAFASSINGSLATEAVLKDCKKWRLMADIFNDVAFLIDLLAATTGDWFIFFAVGSSMLRSFVGVAGGATRAAIVQHQARRYNLADVAAKDGSQETLVNLTALIASLVIIPAAHGNSAIVWSLYIFFTVLHLFANYMAVRSLQFDILNERTLVICVRQFIKNRTVPSIAEANKWEPIFGNVSGPRHFGCKILSAMPPSISSKNYFLRYDFKSCQGWLAVSASSTYSDQIRYAFDLEYFAIENRLPTEIDYNEFEREMKNKKWRFDINQLGYDEWRYKLEQ
uniref:GHMP_kinases_C domain-containing protein n=1 Tax=Steinernema glaseri TaxID=37863 RepID=A0A1I8A3Y6_9BILA